MESEEPRLPAVRCIAWLGRSIRRDLAVFDFGSFERSEDGTMDLVRPCIVSLIVPRDPILELIQHGILILTRSVLMCFPGTTGIVCETGLHTWVEEDQKRAISRRGLNEFAVAALDDPADS